MKQYTATANDDGVRLSRFVQSVTRDFPTSLLYKSFRNKRVKVNGKKAAPEYRLQAGDLIELYINDEFFPPVIKKNFGKWLYHEILEPGVLMHVAEGGDKVYTVRVGGTRTMSITHIRELCDIADKYCGGYLRWTTRNNIEFMVEDEETMKALRDDLNSRKFDGGSFKFPVGGTGAGM